MLVCFVVDANTNAAEATDGQKQIIKSPSDSPVNI